MSSPRLLLIPLCLATLAPPAGAQQPAGEAQARQRAPVEFEADSLEGSQNTQIVASGGVCMKQLDEQFEADWLRYLPQTDELEARGNVRLSRPDARIEGDELELRIKPRIGEMRNARYAVQSKRAGLARGDAKAIQFQGPDRYRLLGASYTTCQPGSSDWFLETGKIDLDYTRNLGTAKHVRVRYQGVPILYTPWMDFSLDNRRKTGFLAPSYGASDQRGGELLVPWYWNIAPNQDATVYPRYMSKRGLQLGAEYRYLQPNFGGELAFEYLPDDDATLSDRYRGVVRHNQRFGPRWSGSVNYERVSDDAYFTDLSSLVRETSRVNLPQEASLGYDGGWWKASGRVQRYQTLQDPNALVTPPYERVPQLLLSASRFSEGRLPLQFDLGGEFVRYEHKSVALAEGNRLDIHPSLSLPMQTSYGYLTPKLGWRYTRYELDRNPGGALSYTRSLPILSLDTGLTMEKDSTVFGNGYTQTLEPRAFYVYIPNKDQSGIPVFDTAERDLSLDQLFSENQYSGPDRINDANQLTVAVTSRLIEPKTGIERFQLTLGQRFYFSDQRVVLPGQPVRDSNATDVLLQASGQVTDRLRLTSGVQYNTDQGSLVKGNVGTSYRAGPGRLFNADYRYTKASLNQVDFSWQWPVKPKWHSVGRVNYSIRESRIVEGLAGFEYNAGCWSLRGVVQRLATTATEVSNAFFLQLELQGLTALGPNPLEVLKRSISGYTKSDELNLP